MTEQIRFEDARNYEQYMGFWSKLVGEVFLDWLNPKPQQRWLDIGCGSGSFTELFAQRYQTASIHGLDPSEAQLAYARTRLPNAQFVQGDAMDLPFDDHSFDIALMPLVIFFVPDPAKGVAEMARVVAPGGSVSSYAWDMYGGGFPYTTLLQELKRFGFRTAAPPSAEASQTDQLEILWHNAGLHGIETRQIEVQHHFADFEAYWQTINKMAHIRQYLSAMPSDQLQQFQSALAAALPINTAGQIVCSARANAIKGFVKH
jgi:ubiquinone/menaquinone biosynthesis C-methylase UbiE